MYQGEGSLILLHGIIESCYHLHSSSYTADLQQIYPVNDEPVYHLLLSLGDSLLRLRELCTQGDKPIFVGSPLELFWVAAGEKQDGQLVRIHISGPVFLGSASIRMIKETLNLKQVSILSSRLILEKIEKLPVLSISHMTTVAQIMHYCITGQAFSFDQFQYLDFVPRQLEAESVPQTDAHAYRINWLNEQRLRELFRTGTLNFSEQFSQLQFQTHANTMMSTESLRNIKDTVISGITMYSRAAMEGGLPPEIGYPLAELYIQRLEAADSFADVVEVNGMAMNDFITRVNRYREQDEVSLPIRRCREYIHMNIEQDLKIAQIAEHFGYTGYYLSRRFKAEMEMSIQEYINCARVEHAKMLLQSTTNDIQSISERMHFCNPSYFARIFRKYAGVSPAVYRNQPEDQQ